MALVSPLRLLDFWHLFSLDAPTVAVVWMLAVDRSGGFRPGPVLPAALFFAVWILYAGDRLLDARPLRAERFQQAEGQAAEHRPFHHRHQTGFLIGLAAMFAALAVLLFHLPPSTLGAELVLAVPLAV